jgi:DNA-binding transcriptional regulator LsrR (DeoR family)
MTKDKELEARNEHMALLYADGWLEQEIADAYGLTIGMVSKILRHPKHDKVVSRGKEMLALADKGWTERELAEEFGISKTAVHWDLVVARGC